MRFGCWFFKMVIICYVDDGVVVWGCSLGVGLGGLIYAFFDFGWVF